MTIRRGDISLGKTADEILAAFYKHPGQGFMKPFGFDVHQGFEFFLHHDGKLYRKAPGVMIEMTPTQESELHENIQMGAVEMYLRRPTANLDKTASSEMVIIHAANGRQLEK